MNAEREAKVNVIEAASEEPPTQPGDTEVKLFEEEVKKEEEEMAVVKMELE